MRLAIRSTVMLVGGLLAATSLAACSSSSTSSESSAAGSAAAVASSGAAVASAAESAAVVDAAYACAQVNDISANTLQNGASTDGAAWHQASEDMLGLSSDTSDEALSAALQSLAVGAEFTSSGLAGGDTLDVAVTGYTDALPELQPLCEAAGTPLK